MDDLKRYLQQHREQLDTEEPGEMLWKQMRDVMHPKKAKTIPLYIKWVAAACIVALAGIAIYLSMQNKPGDKSNTPEVADHNHQHTDSNHKHSPKEEITQVPVTDTDKKEPVVAKSNTAPKKKTAPQRALPNKKAASPIYGFEAVEASYAGMLDMQLERIRRQPIYAEDAEYFHSFKKEFAELGNQEEQLKRRIKDNGMRDEYLDDLITIYQGKINVLKQLQFEINKMNNRVKQADPSINQLSPSYINL